eukprot:scaffold179891_cov27-Tisochrysis_lutea.AAC.1
MPHWRLAATGAKHKQRYRDGSLHHMGRKATPFGPRCKRHVQSTKGRATMALKLGHSQPTTSAPCQPSPTSDFHSPQKEHRTRSHLTPVFEAWTRLLAHTRSK